MLQQRWHAIVTRELGFKNLDEMQVCAVPVGGISHPCHASQYLCVSPGIDMPRSSRA
jgi:hypothetical protein